MQSYKSERRTRTRTHTHTHTRRDLSATASLLLRLGSAVSGEALPPAGSGKLWPPCYGRSPLSLCAESLGQKSKEDKLDELDGGDLIRSGSVSFR